MFYDPAPSQIQTRMERKTLDSNVEALETFLIDSKEWLSDADAPAVMALKQMAAQLDKRFSAATMAQYGLFLRALAKKAPSAEGDIDPLEALLSREQ